MNYQILSSTTLTGTKVNNLKGDNIGTIEDLAIDLERGNVLYGVLSFGGFMGMGDKYFAIPVEALQTDIDDTDKVTLDIDKEKLEEAPGFDKDDWPAMPKPEFIDSVYSYYGYERDPYFTLSK